LRVSGATALAQRDDHDDDELDECLKPNAADFPPPPPPLAADDAEDEEEDAADGKGDEKQEETAAVPLPALPPDWEGAHTRQEQRRRPPLTAPLVCA
jgi:hypothetical protein